MPCQYSHAPTESYVTGLCICTAIPRGGNSAFEIGYGPPTALLLAAIGPKVIGTYPGSQVAKSDRNGGYTPSWNGPSGSQTTPGKGPQSVTPVTTLQNALGRFHRQKSGVFRHITVRLVLMVLAAIGPKVIGTNPGSRVAKKASVMCDSPRGMGPGDFKPPKVGILSRHTRHGPFPALPRKPRPFHGAVTVLSR